MLGLVQGLTEFLPVSSSGHLVLMQFFLGLKEPMLFFDILLHVGTLAAVFLVYRSDIRLMIREIILAARDGFKNPSRFPQAKAAGMILVACVPTALMGLTLEEVFEELFVSPLAVGVMLLVTGGLLFATRGKSDGGREEGALTVKEAIIIGIAQGCAITPGISRSGITIATALFLGIRRESAARFSFLLSIPAILGAFIFKVGDVSVAVSELPVYVAGTVVSFIVGVAALVLLINIVKRGKLDWFSWYVWVMGILVIWNFASGHG